MFFADFSHFSAVMSEPSVVQRGEVGGGERGLTWRQLHPKPIQRNARRPVRSLRRNRPAPGNRI